MKNSLCILVIVSLVNLSGCGDYSNKYLQEDLEFLYAVPAKSTLEIRVAESQARQVSLAGQSSTLANRSDAVLGQTANWYVFTQLISLDVNLHVFGFLDMVDVITGFPPSAREDNVRLWGPWASRDTPNTDWRFVMEKDVASGIFSLDLQVNSVASRNTSAYVEGWQDCLSGTIDPSQSSFRRGTGNLTAYVEICNKYDQTGEKGSVSIGFDTSPDHDNPSGKTDLTIVFSDFISKDMFDNNPDPQPLNAEYRYLELGDLSGEFDFDVWTDIDEGQNPAKLAEEHVVLKVAWDDTGAGRADSLWTDGDLGALVILLSECWDSDKKRVYYEDSLGMAPTEGLPGDCVMEPAVFD